MPRDLNPGLLHPRPGTPWHNETPPPPVCNLSPQTEVHLPPWLEKLKVKQRRRCKKVCPGKEPGYGPGDYLCWLDKIKMK